MSQEKRALSDRRAEARRVTEQVEISRQIAARTPPQKPKAVESVKAGPASLAANPDIHVDIDLDVESEEDDADEKVERPA